MGVAKVNRFLNILLAILFVALGYYLAVWVLGIAGIALPARVLQIIFAIVVIMLAIWIWNNGDRPIWKRGP